MKTTDFAKDAAKKCGCTVEAAKKVVDMFLSEIVEELKKDGKSCIVAFGTFSVRDLKEREGINPKSGEKIHIDAGKGIKFKASKGIVERVKEG